MKWYKKAKAQKDFALTYEPSFCVDLNKEAKLADKGGKLIGNGKNIFTVCQYCDRWATQEDNDEEYVGEGNVIWKKAIPGDMTEDELEQVEWATLEAKNHKGVGLSHGICSYCMPFVNKIFEKSKTDPNAFDFDHEELAKKSLGLS